jgi:IQ calmodulin-binding motif
VALSAATTQKFTCCLLDPSNQARSCRHLARKTVTRASRWIFACSCAAMPRQWVLRSVTDATRVHKLIGPSFRVGSASTADLCITKLDEQHAVIDISAAGTAILRDAGGAQGVFFAESGRGRLEQLGDDEEVEIEKGDAVRFGSEQENTYTVEHLQCPTKLAVTVLGVDHITANAKSSTPRSLLGAKQMLIHVTLELCSVTASTAAVKCTSSKALFGTSGELVELVVPDNGWTAGLAPIEHAVKLTVYNGKVVLGSIVTTVHRLQDAAQQDRGMHCEFSSTAQGFIMLSNVTLKEIDATAATTTSASGANQTTPNKSKASGITASKSFFRSSPRNNADANSTTDSNTTAVAAAAAAAQSPSNSGVMNRLGSAFLASPRSMANVLADKMKRKPGATTTAATATAAAADDRDADSNSDNNDDNVVDTAVSTDTNNEQYEALIIRFTAIEARNLAECTPKSIIGARKKKGVTQDPHVAITAAGVSAQTAPVVGGATKPVFGTTGDGESLTLVIIGSVWSASTKGAADCSKLPLKIDIWNGELLLGTVEKTLTTLVKAAQLNGTGIVDLINAKGKQQGLLEYSITVEGGNIDQSALISNDATAAAVASNDDSDTALNNSKKQQQQLKGSSNAAVTKGASPLGSKRRNDNSVRKGGGISDSSHSSDSDISENDDDVDRQQHHRQQQHTDDNSSDSDTATAATAAAASTVDKSRLKPKVKQPAVTAQTATATAAKRTTAIQAASVSEVKTPRSPSIATPLSAASQSAATVAAAAAAAKVDAAVISASTPTVKAVIAPAAAQQATVAAQEHTAATGVGAIAVVKDRSRPASPSIQQNKPATAGTTATVASSAVSGDNAQDNIIDAAARSTQGDASVPQQHAKHPSIKADSTNNKKLHNISDDSSVHTKTDSTNTNAASSNEPTAEQLEAEATRLAGVKGEALAEQAIQDELRQERLQRARQIAAKRRADAVHYGPMGRRIYSSSSSYSNSGNGSSEQATAEHTQAATAIQSVWRSKQSRKQLKRQHRSARAIQAAVRGRLDRKKFETLAAKAKAAELDEQIRVTRRRRIAAKEAELKLLTATSARDLQKLDALRQHASARTLQQWWCKRTSSSSASSSGATVRRSSAKKRVVKSSTNTDNAGTDDDTDMLYYAVPNRSVAIAAQRKESTRHRYSVHQHAYDHDNSSATTTGADRLSDVYKRVAAAANSTVTDSTVAHSMAHATATRTVHNTDAQLQDSSYSSRQRNSVHHKYETLLNAREQSNDLLLQRQNDAIRQQAASKRRAELLQNFKELQLQLTHPPALTTVAATAAPISSVKSITAATAMQQWLPTDSKALARAVMSHERTVTTLKGKDRWYSTHLNQNSGGRAIDIRTMQSFDWPFENGKQPIKKHRTRYAQYSNADAAAGADDCEQSLWWHAYASKQREQPLVATTADLQQQQQQQQQYSSATTDRVSQKLYEQVQLGPIARREATLEYVHAKHDRIAQNVTALVQEVEHRRCDASSGSGRYSTYSRYSISAVSAKQQYDAATLLQSRARGMSARKQTGKISSMLKSVGAMMLSCALLCDELTLALRKLEY